jgi:hypothetical protein
MMRILFQILSWFLVSLTLAACASNPVIIDEQAHPQPKDALQVLSDNDNGQVPKFLHAEQYQRTPLAKTEDQQ